MSKVLPIEYIYFEDLEVGMEAQSPARTMTETDVVNFAGLSGDYNIIHTDKEFCAGTPFGERIAHGVLGLSFATGLVARNPNASQHKMAAFLGLNWEFKRPIHIGDTIHVIQRVAAKEETRKADLGMVTFHVQVKNQKNKVCQEGEWRVLYLRKIIG